ncbi:magnesium-transporting ATPase (P-type) [Paenibacillus sp. 1182]|uniref:hypothetical protein n=1 Tax=Paenibacillus sp. 1182 TaxID=2806565 RepID=UPI001AEACE46|nr:hypothetical protein [Paenibacillus sp. 1182]MBP1308971.1 magnesium-transporting ATPase (P-type) [Paenibacillus sp. 1182]
MKKLFTNKEEILQNSLYLNQIIKIYRLRIIWFTFFIIQITIIAFIGIIKNWSDIESLYTEVGIGKLISSIATLFAFFSILTLAIIHLLNKRFPGFKGICFSLLFGLIETVGFLVVSIADVTLNSFPFIIVILEDYFILVSFILLPEMFWKKVIDLYRFISQRIW